MSELPYYKRYPANILADCRRLSAAEYGAYNFLLDTMWLQGGRLPFESRDLARIAGVDSRCWARVWARIESYFIVSDDGKWISQKRMNREIEEARELNERRRVSGQTGGRAHWEKPRKQRAQIWREQERHDPPANPLENNNAAMPSAIAHASKTKTKANKDKSEALFKGASSYPLANDLPASASSAREAERQAEWLHKKAERNRPADPNHPSLLQAEAEQVETYRRGKRLREKLKAAGFKGFRIIPP